MKQVEYDLTRDSVWRQLIRMSGPLMLSNIIQALYGVVDMAIVGRYIGPSALSAVSIAGQITLFLTAFGTGLSNGGSVVISQNKGSGNSGEQAQIIGTTISLFFVAALLLSVPVLLFCPHLLRLLNTPKEAFEQASVYLMICGGGTVFVFGYNALSSTLRGLGNTRTPLQMVIISAGVNILLDLLLVGGFGLGTFGAAIATVLSQLLSFSTVLVFLMRRSDIVFPHCISDYRPMPRYIRPILRTGMPSAIQSGVVLLTLLIVSSMINAYGLTVSAAYGIGVKLDNFSIMPRQAVAGASSAIVAQNTGAGLEHRSKDTLSAAMVLSLATALISFLIVQMFPRFLISLFDRSLDIVDAGTRYLRITSIGYFFAAAMGAFNSLAIGVGYTSFAMFNSILDSVIARLGLCLLLGFSLGLGLIGIYWSLGFAPAAAAINGFLFYKSGKWRGHRINLG